MLLEQSDIEMTVSFLSNYGFFRKESRQLPKELRRESPTLLILFGLKRY